MSPTSLVFDAATNTSRRPNWSAIIDNHLPTTENLRKPPQKKSGCRRSARGCDVILWQPIADWSAIIDKYLPTSDNLRQPPKKSGCQRSATGCRYSVTGALPIPEIGGMYFPWDRGFRWWGQRIIYVGRPIYLLDSTGRGGGGTTTLLDNYG